MGRAGAHSTDGSHQEHQHKILARLTHQTNRARRFPFPTCIGSVNTSCHGTRSTHTRTFAAASAPPLVRQLRLTLDGRRMLQAMLSMGLQEMDAPRRRNVSSCASGASRARPGALAAPRGFVDELRGCPARAAAKRRPVRPLSAMPASRATGVAAAAARWYEGSPCAG